LLVTKTDRGDPLRIWSIPQGQLLRKIQFDEFRNFMLRGPRLLTLARTPGECWFRSQPLPDGAVDDLGRVKTRDITDWDVDATGKWLALGRGQEVLLRPLDR